MPDENKVQFNLKNVHYAAIEKTIDAASNNERRRFVSFFIVNPFLVCHLIPL